MELLGRGWDDVSIEKLIGRNILRVMEEAERVSLIQRNESNGGCGKGKFD